MLEENKEFTFEKLTKKQLADVLKMANDIYYNYPQDYYSSNIANKNLNDLLNNPKKPSDSDTYNRVLDNYVDNADILQAYSEYMDATDILYKRLENYYSGLLSFDLDVTCRNAFTEEDFESELYKKDCKIKNSFLDNFNYKQEFKNVLRQCIRRETYYTWLRSNDKSITNDMNSKKVGEYMLQPLPQSSCKLTGMWDKGYLFDFDMNYFNRAGTNISKYDKVFEKYLIRALGDKYDSRQKVSENIQKLEAHDGSWVQTSPYDGAWVWKFDYSSQNETPFLASIIYHCLDTNEVSKLQKDKDILSAYAMLVGEIQLNNKQKGSVTTDMLAYKTTTLQTFLRLVTLGLKNNIKAVAMPTGNPKLEQYQDYNENMYKNKLKATVGQGVSASGVVYSDEKSSDGEVKAQITNDYNLVLTMYEQFNNFLNYYVNRKTSKYKFSFSFHGSNYLFIREEEKKARLELSAIGFVGNASFYSGIVGMKPQEFERSLTEAKFGGLQDILTSLSSIHTANNKVTDVTDEGGRPTKEEGE